jgi:hypothetical protein
MRTPGFQAEASLTPGNEAYWATVVAHEVTNTAANVRPSGACGCVNGCLGVCISNDHCIGTCY